MAISRKVHLRTISAVALAASLGLAQPAHAQLTTATIRGQVTTSAGAVPGAIVTADNVDTRTTTPVTVGPDQS